MSRPAPCAIGRRSATLGSVGEKPNAGIHTPAELFTYGLFPILRRWGWVFRRHGAGAYVPYETQVRAGRMELKVTTIRLKDGTRRSWNRRCSGEGLTDAAHKLRAERKGGPRMSAGKVQRDSRRLLARWRGLLGAGQGGWRPRSVRSTRMSRLRCPL